MFAEAVKLFKMVNQHLKLAHAEDYDPCQRQREPKDLVSALALSIDQFNINAKQCCHYSFMESEQSHAPRK